MALLTVTLPKDSTSIQGVAIINAPLNKVFEAYIKEELFKQWFGRGNPVDVKAFEAKSGGVWHIAENAPDGEAYEFYGAFHEVAMNQRIIWTFEFLGMPERGHVALERMDFTETEDGKTEIRSLSTYQTVKDRDGMVASGMEEGWRESVNALEKILT